MKDKKSEPESTSSLEYVLNQKNASNFINYPSKEKQLLNKGVLWHKIIVSVNFYLISSNL